VGVPRNEVKSMQKSSAVGKQVATPIKSEHNNGSTPKPQD